MLWQAGSGYRFRLLDGYALNPGAGGSPEFGPRSITPPGLQQFLANQEGMTLYGRSPLGRMLLATTRTVLARYDVGLIIVDRGETGAGPVMRLFRSALGPPQVSTGGFSVWSRAESNDVRLGGRRPWLEMPPLLSSRVGYVLAAQFVRSHNARTPAPVRRAVSSRTRERSVLVQRQLRGAAR